MKHLAFLFVFLAMTTQVFAEVPKLINYSGKLTDKAGNIVADGVYDMRFSLWTQATGGTEDWFEEHYIAQGRGVQSFGGGFNVVLGGTTALPAFDQNYWVEITVTINSTPETFGRQEIISVPYALQVADNSVTGSKIVDGSITGSDLAGDTITWAQILDGTIRSFELQDGAVTPPKAPWAPTVNGGINNPKIAYGVRSTDDNGDADVTFPFVFITTPAVVAVPVVVFPNPAAHQMNISNITLSGFHANTFNDWGGGVTHDGPISFHWIAIGQ